MALAEAVAAMVAAAVEGVSKGSFDFKENSERLDSNCE